MSRDTHEKRSSGTNINLEETAEADNTDRRKDKRRHSSGSSTRSAGSARKKHKLGRSTEKTQILRVLKIRKNGQKKKFCFRTMILPNGQKDLSHL